MDKLYLKVYNSTPQYICSNCCHCSSLFGTSLCKIKNRGCCSYFPKFYLYNIQKMSKSKNGIEVLNKILSSPGSTIYRTYIHCKGYFDKTNYEFNLNNGNLDNLKVHDKTIFFRTCPFIQPNVGCSIPAEFRNHICNFFICDEITTATDNPSEFEKYKKESISYDRWINYENESLYNILKENNTDLEKNFNKSLEILKSLELNTYDFPNLQDINIKNLNNSNYIFNSLHSVS